MLFAIFFSMMLTAVVNEVNELMKTQVYKAVVLSTLICVSESRVLYCKHIQLLDCFHQWCLLFHHGNPDYKTNTEVGAAGSPSIEAMLLLRQLC